ncbi:MAG: hypothetical protein JW863_17610 [Chitinispirillaceae bacterium]|nr:hypothetical protein [Chitinispirillaceae bacterium]
METVTNSAGTVCIAATRWSAADTFGALRCRLGGFRMKYTIEPGLYGIGTPDSGSPVFVSANYKLSFDHLRRSLSGNSGWILVLDTRGINVWCAAGKGTFGTKELIDRIESCGLAAMVKHRKIIVPQLGAPGIAAHEISKATGFKVVYGPVRSSDIHVFLSSGMIATPEMRRVRFGVLDRLVLTPMELRPTLGIFLPVLVAGLAFTGIEQTGILFASIRDNGLPLMIAALLSLFTGTILTPILLPWIPFRAFSIKGLITGVAAMAFYIPLSTITDPLLQLFSFLFFPVYSSFCALNFTGSTPYTGISGVKREMKFAVPLYVAVSVIGGVLLIAYKIRHLLFPGGVI